MSEPNKTFIEKEYEEESLEIHSDLIESKQNTNNMECKTYYGKHGVTSEDNTNEEVETSDHKKSEEEKEKTKLNKFKEKIFDSSEQIDMDSYFNCHNKSQKFEDSSSEPDNKDKNYGYETDSCMDNSNDIFTDFEHLNDRSPSTAENIDKEIINNQLIVLEPNNPVMMRFQSTLKQHLLKQKYSIEQELLTLDGIIKSKQNKKDEFINEINNIASQVDFQHSLLSEFQRMKLELETTQSQVETYIDHRKQQSAEILTKTTIETKKFSDLMRHLDCSRGLLNELMKYEKEQETTFNMCNQKKSETKQYKKKLLNKQQKQDLLLLSLTQEIFRLETCMKQLGKQAETKYNERELLKQKVTDRSIDLDSINGDNAKITLLWNEVLISIQQRDKSFQKIKIDFQEAQNKYQILLIEANSFKRSFQDESKKNNDILSYLNKLKQEQTTSQKNLNSYLDNFNYLKDEYTKLIQITEFQNQNLDQVISDQKLIQTEINTSLCSLEKKSNQKLKYEEDIVNELKKHLFANNHCIQMNNKISEIKIQNKEHELMLNGIENNLSQSLLKLEQYCMTSSNLEKDVEKDTKYLINQGAVIFELNSELKKLHTNIECRSRQIELETKKLETIKKKCDEGYIVTPQIKIDQVIIKIKETKKEIDFMKEVWVQKQNNIIQLMDQRNKQFNKQNKLCKYASVMDIKNKKLEEEMVSLTKEVDQYKRTIKNKINLIMKLNDNFSQNKGKSNQLLNENEWIQCSYLAELKENENKCLEYTDQLKLLKNELSDLKNTCVEKQRESKSWDTKVHLLIEMKKEILQKDGDLGDIDAMKNEIHRMQIRESQLKKILEKIMSDLEVCITKREMIYSKVAAKDIRLKGKNETKQKFLKKLDDLRLNIKKLKIECKKLDRSISDLQHEKIELENNLIFLNSKLIQTQKNINDIVNNLEAIDVTKTKNIQNLSYKQCHAKFLDEVKKGKYRLLIKNESRMNEEHGVEWKKNSDLISVVEALKNDFPYLDFQITRLINILKAFVS